MFDSIMSYVTPILIEEQGFSNTMIGLIIGTSSITGALFDFLICKFFKNTNYRRIFLLMFAICFIYPLLLWQAKTVWMFMIAMAAWGVYYDFYGFGTFDFVGRHTKEKEHAQNFGMIQMFRALGGILGPLIVGLVIINGVDGVAFGLGWLFLSISFLIFLAFAFSMRRQKTIHEIPEAAPRRKNFFIEINLWKKISKMILPALLVTFYIYLIDAFFWTLIPLFAEASGLGQFGGLLITAYTVPALIAGWSIGLFTKRYGKNKTAFVSLLVGSLILSLFYYISNTAILIAAIFVASLFISMALPAINATYADHISESPKIEEEIEGLGDFAFNIGYVVGPISAGFMADVIGISGAFSVLGISGAVLAMILLVTSSKGNKIKMSLVDL